MDSVTSKKSILPALTTEGCVMAIELYGEEALVMRSKVYCGNISVASPFPPVTYCRVFFFFQPRQIVIEYPVRAKHCVLLE